MMVNKDGKPLSTINELHVELRWLEWAKGLSQESLTAITNAAEHEEYQTGEVVVELEEEITHVWFLIAGRLQVTLYDVLGKEINRDTFVRGSVLGLFSLGLSDRSHLQVQATEPSRAIRLTLSDLLNLTAKYPDFQLIMFRLAANMFKRFVTVDRSLPRPSVVGIVHHSDASRQLAVRLARRLRELDESPCIAGDDERWKPEGNIPYKLLARNGGAEERVNILKDWASNRRLLLDVRFDHPLDQMIRFCGYVDQVLWCVRPQDALVAVPLLQELEKNVPKWRDKIRVVWLLNPDAPVAPHLPELYELCERDFKVTFDRAGPNQGSLLGCGLERIVHHLRGIQIGLALGGGAARGMAHLGVLKALERHGIYIDMLAGTSAGAMTGTVYAAGLDPEYLTGVFRTDLKPSWFFRQLPSGGYWYLIFKYRRNQFDPMLRKYLDRLTMKQLQIPMFTVSVDLVEGQAIVRDSGDATTNVLESINLPPLSLPLCSSGQAVVDGGLLNNIPADVLVSKGCNFVIASTVTAKLEKEFMGVRSSGHFQKSRFFSTLHVILRQHMIQDYNMNSVGIQPADFVIAPDVTSFDISEFTRADEMAHIGEATTDAVVAKLHKMLNRLDSKLFESSLAA
jgi:predicted acylesterase/phospholipase RssA/CRP-like cAMP-binding protein